MKRWISAVLATALLVLAGCGSGGGDGSTGESALRVGLVTDTAGVNDQSYNAAAYRGLQQAEEELGASISVIESAKQEDYAPNLAGLADTGFDLVWGVGFAIVDAMAEAAATHPDTSFGVIDAVVEAPNVVSVNFKQAEGSFLVGVIAAKATQTKKVGFIGGQDAPIMREFETGFRAGVMSVDPTIEVQTAWVGSFTDPAKGKQTAEQMYGSGVDVIYHASGGTGLGVIEAARDHDRYVIGVDSDQNHLAPEHVITSMLKRVDVAVFEMTRRMVEGDFPGGQVVVMGLAEDGVGYSDTTLWDKLPPDTKDLVDRYKAAIIDGTIAVPDSPEALEAFEPADL